MIRRYRDRIQRDGRLQLGIDVRPSCNTPLSVATVSFCIGKMCIIYCLPEYDAKNVWEMTQLRDLIAGESIAVSDNPYDCFRRANFRYFGAGIEECIGLLRRDYAMEVATTGLLTYGGEGSLSELVAAHLVSHLDLPTDPTDWNVDICEDHGLAATSHAYLSYELLNGMHLN